MARVKPFDLAVVQAWLSAWNERDIFSDAAVRHLQSLIIDPLCVVVVTLGVGREPRSLVFRRIKQMIPVLVPPLPALKPTLYAVHGDDGRFRILHTKSKGEGIAGEREGIRWQPFASSRAPAAFPEMIVGSVAPVDPSVGQLWHQTGVKSETVPKLDRVLRWDGADWVIAGLVTEIGGVAKQGMQVCDFQEALACAYEHTRWGDCEFIYTYDGSTWGNG